MFSRRVDDAVGVGFFGRITLEEALVDFVEESLLFGNAGGVFGADFDGLVEAVERAQEFISVEGAVLHPHLIASPSALNTCSTAQ